MTSTPTDSAPTANNNPADPSEKSDASSTPAPQAPQLNGVGPFQITPQMLAQAMATQQRMGAVRGVPMFVPMPMAVGSQQITWNGPYPPPDCVERYEKVLPGSFDRILAMAERMEAAQIEQSKLALIHAHKDASRGHWLGFAVGALAVIGAMFCAKLGQPLLGGGFLAVPLTGLGKAFVESVRNKPTDMAVPETQPQEPKSQPQKAAS